MKRGQQKHIPAFTSPNPSYHLIGAYLWSKDQVFTQAVDRKNDHCHPYVYRKLYNSIQLSTA